MIGVILWSDAQEGKAVIWCEDQGHLAYMSRCETSGDAQKDGRELDVGDVVQFDVEVHQNLRLAQNVARLTTQWGTAAVSALRSIRKEPETDEICPSVGAKIIPFRLAQSHGRGAAETYLPARRQLRMGDRS